jgi:tRNA pseudouridine55 synthase
LAKVRKGEALDGVLLLDKPSGYSSNQVLQKCKWLFNAQKAGHTGSLDPIATGMLPICFGQATKFSHFLLIADKCYQVKLMLGVTTTTGDSEGEVLSHQSVPLLDRTQIEIVLNEFIGTQQQVPPMYSALKFQGKPLYQLARQGKTIERQPRTITISEIVFDEMTKSTNPLLTLTVTCSKGTYIRTLAEDIGQKLGVGAHVVDLRRLWVQPFAKAPMLTLDHLIGLASELRSAELLSIDMAFSSILPNLKLSEEETFYLRRGVKLTLEGTEKVGLLVLKGPDEQFLGVGERLANGQLAPRRLMHEAL